MSNLSKMEPCFNCRTDDNLGVYTYENGARHVECVKCNYLGPPCTSKPAAVKRHNERMCEMMRKAIIIDPRDIPTLEEIEHMRETFCGRPGDPTEDMAQAHRLFTHIESQLKARAA